MKLLLQCHRGVVGWLLVVDRLKMLYGTVVCSMMLLARKLAI